MTYQKQDRMRLKATLTFIVMTIAFWTGHARNPISDTLFVKDSIPEGYELVDSIVYIPSPAVDTALAGKTIFSELPLIAKGDEADVRIHQSREIWDAMSGHFQSNRSRTMSGYRVRIFFDNRRTARTESENTLNRFVDKYHDVTAYRSYVNPYFKVTVGDFRTKSEAMQFLMKIQKEFPSAFIVKENISYPTVDKAHPMTVDTVRILRAIQTEEL